MEQLNRANKKRRVMIGSPCMYGDINVWYVNSLVNTIKMSHERNVEITPIWLSYDALIQRVRNDTLDIAITQEFDDLVWIDCDIEWDPEDFYKLLDYPVDVVGGTYRKKGDVEEYVLRKHDLNDTKIFPGTDLVSVLGLGTGFVRMSKKACLNLYENSPKYYDDKEKKIKRMVFNVYIDHNHPSGLPQLISEDLAAFEVLVKNGIDIWFDPNITCKHIGSYKFEGDYNSWNNLPQAQKQLRIQGLPAIQRQLPQRQLPEVPKIKKQL